MKLITLIMEQVFLYGFENESILMTNVGSNVTYDHFVIRGCDLYLRKAAMRHFPEWAPPFNRVELFFYIRDITSGRQNNFGDGCVDIAVCVWDDYHLEKD
jgi:hypothetical protein